MAEFNLAHVARLARIELTPEEASRIEAQLQNILGYVAQLNEVNVDGVEPMTHPIPVMNVTRPDEPLESLGHAQVFRNAPAHAGSLFLTPKIVE